MKIVLIGYPKCIHDNKFQVIRVNILMVNEEYNILQIGVVSPVDFAKGYAVRVCNKYFQVAELQCGCSVPGCPRVVE